MNCTYSGIFYRFVFSTSMINQRGVSLVSDILPDKRKELEAVLSQLQQLWFDHKPLSLESLGTVHFCRWVILDEINTETKVYPDRLFFEINYDGEDDAAQIKSWTEHCGDLLNQVYQFCEGFPINGDGASKLNYLTSCIVDTTVFYNSSPGRDLGRIKREDQLYNGLKDHVIETAHDGYNALQIVNLMRDFVRSKPEFQWALNRNKIPGIHIPGVIFTLLVTLLLLPVAIILILIIQFFYESKDKPLGIEPGEVNRAHMNKLEELEDIYFQNQFSQVLYMKPGLVRRITIRLVLLFTKGLGTFLMVQGKLMDIPTIHFARWVMLDKDKHMMFTSNFDGSWQQYLGDFIDKSGWGLTAIWSNAMGFPKTNFLFTGGAYNEQQFLAWSRHFQVCTQFWYSAYPDLSIKNIINNSYVAHDLFKNMNEKQAQQYLKRF